ncbi:MAG: glycosyltransferase [Rhodospirillaceae bacterium]|nr:MAG: glycosyltransferase [Rhodospirillaceae bacterium]
MKLLVFAHVPPPHHGQSYMVQLMLNGLGGDHRAHKRKHVALNPAGDALQIECYHVNARLSKTLEDIGELHAVKLILLFGYCLQAIWCRVRYGVTNFYYIPAPGKSSALVRDWMVMFLCRPFFKRVILHWHAAGLAKWLETAVQIRTRAFTYQLTKTVDLSIVLSRYNLADAEKLLPQRVRIVSNGIPDPCPDFDQTILPLRRARFAARIKLLAGAELTAADLADTGGHPETVRVLYLAHCMREKGVFDAMQAVLLANRTLDAERSLVRLKLQVAGAFVTGEERAEFERLMTDPEMAFAVEPLGFISGEAKDRALRRADLFCFPTYYLGENQPVNLIEAMAYGLPTLTTRWRSLPEMFPHDYAGLVDIKSPAQAAEGMLGLMRLKTGEKARERFLAGYTLDRHLASLAEAILSVERAAPQASRAVLVQI